MALVKFPLIMADGFKANTLDQFKEHFDIGSVVSYFHDGRLIRWLRINRCAEEFAAVEKLSANEINLAQKLGAIFGFDIPPDEDFGDGDLTKLLIRLKQYTADKELLAQIEQELSEGTALVAFNQTELDEEAQYFDKIYLVAETFVIPLDKTGKNYIGIGDKATAVIESDKPVNLKRLKITLEKLRVEGAIDPFIEILDKLKPHATARLLGQIRRELRDETAHVAFNQDELNEHVKKFDKIYLVAESFVIPLDKTGKTYVGVGEKATAVIDSAETVNFDELKITFENITFDDTYQNLIQKRQGLILCIEGRDARMAEDYTTALEKFKKSAELGCAQAFANIGNIYHFGTGVKKDIHEARRWYKRGMEKNDGDSFGFYAISLDSYADEREAFNCMKRATELNPEFGGWWNDLGDMYFYGTGTEKNLAKAFECYEKGAQAGSSRAANMLGIMYGKGEYVEQNERKAFEFFKKAVELDDTYITAVKNLAYCYSNGEGVGQDSYEAFKLYKQAAEAGDVEAMEIIADMFIGGEGTPKDEYESFRWMKKSVDEGNDNVSAIRNLALHYRYGIGTPKDLTKSVPLYYRAADRGDIRATITMGELFRDGEGVDKNFKEALRYFQRAADKDDGEAMNSLALIYDQGGYGVAQDAQKAFEWFKKSAEAGNANGMSNLSLCYLWGSGIRKNTNLAEYWMKKAAENGAFYGMLKYANWLASQDKKDRRLVAMYEQAANAGYGEAAYKLSMIYLNGWGVAQSDRNYEYWLTKSQELGYDPD